MNANPLLSELSSISVSFHFAPVGQDLHDCGVVLEGAVDLGLGREVLFPHADVGVSDGLDLLLGQGDQLVLPGIRDCVTVPS